MTSLVLAHWCVGPNGDIPCPNDVHDVVTAGGGDLGYVVAIALLAAAVALLLFLLARKGSRS